MPVCRRFLGPQSVPLPEGSEMSGGESASREPHPLLPLPDVHGDRQPCDVALNIVTG
jgi:hypothetical protein